MLPPPTSLLSSKLRAPGVSPGHHSLRAATCAQKHGLQRNSLPWERIAATAAEMQTKALVQGQFQHQDRQDFRRGIGTYCKRKHNAQKRNPQPYIKLQPTSPALPPSGAENSSPLQPRLYEMGTRYCTVKMIKSTEEARKEPWQFIQRFWPPKGPECPTTPDELGPQEAFEQGCCPRPAAFAQAAAQLSGGNEFPGRAPLTSRTSLLQGFMV